MITDEIACWNDRFEPAKSRTGDHDGPYAAVAI